MSPAELGGPTAPAPIDRRERGPVRPPERRPTRGYALAAAGATMWALNGNLARWLLDDGMSAVRLAQLRSLGSWALLVAALALARPGCFASSAASCPHSPSSGWPGSRSCTRPPSSPSSGSRSAWP
jgi:hypothetical protein